MQRNWRKLKELEGKLKAFRERKLTSVFENLGVFRESEGEQKGRKRGKFLGEKEGRRGGSP